jgi:hypothetical protein
MNLRRQRQLLVNGSCNLNGRDDGAKRSSLRLAATPLFKDDKPLPTKSDLLM